MIAALRADDGGDARRRAVRCSATFLADDAHYRASAAAYGDGGRDALARALDLFLARPEIGFVWLAYADDVERATQAVGACVVCRAISTSRGTLVAKLDDVTVHRDVAGPRRRRARCSTRCATTCARRA